MSISPADVVDHIRVLLDRRAARRIARPLADWPRKNLPFLGAVQQSNVPLEQELRRALDDVARKIGRPSVNHLKEMYPNALAAVPKTAEVSLTNFFRNRINLEMRPVVILATKHWKQSQQRGEEPIVSGTGGPPENARSTSLLHLDPSNNRSQFALGRGSIRIPHRSKTGTRSSLSGSSWIRSAVSPNRTRLFRSDGSYERAAAPASK